MDPGYARPKSDCLAPYMLAPAATRSSRADERAAGLGMRMDVFAV